MSCEKPLVSVFMITYNHEKYIAQAIEGVLMQKTDFHFELIIGEDCSTDRTREVVVDYANKYPEIIKPILHEKNVGMKANGRATREASSGKYVALCEGDDYWIDPLKLQKQVDFMESHPECSLCHTYYREVDESSMEIGSVLPKKKLSSVSEFGDYFPHRSVIRTATVMYRNELTPTPEERKPFIKSIYGDLVLFTILSMKGKIGLLPDVTAHYRVHEGGVSRGDRIPLMENLILTYSEFEKVFCVKRYVSIFRFEQALLCSFMAHLCAKRELTNDAKRFLRKSFTKKVFLASAMRPRFIASLYIFLPRIARKMANFRAQRSMGKPKV